MRTVSTTPTQHMEYDGAAEMAQKLEQAKEHIRMLMATEGDLFNEMCAEAGKFLEAA